MQICTEKKFYVFNAYSLLIMINKFNLYFISTFENQNFTYFFISCDISYIDILYINIKCLRTVKYLNKDIMEPREKKMKRDLS